jgi:signal transduction histidine kinase
MKASGKSIFWGLGLAMLMGEYFRKASRNKTLEQGLEEKNKALEEVNRALQEEIQERRQAEDQLRRMNKQLRDLTAMIQSVREEERTRIAREIHDVLGQQLTVIKLDLAWLSKRIREQELGEKVSMLLATTDETLQAVKKIATELRPGVLDDLGLVAAIEWQCREFESRMGIRCTLNTELHDLECSHEISTAVFRVLQETLTNIVRHAQASNVLIHMVIEDDELTVKISDNGKGITEEEIGNTRSLGLLGMRERMHMIEGKLYINGNDNGTVVKLKVPLKRISKDG